MKKSLFIIIAVVVLIAFGYYFYQGNLAQAPASDSKSTGTMTEEKTNTQPSESMPPANPEPQPQAEAPTPTPTPPPGTTFSDGEGTDGMDIQVVEVIYDGSKYTPNMLNIKVNDYVVFKNNSDTDFWPASAPHPTHTNYSEFDAKKPIAPGGKYQFQFTKEGVWGFHDHLNPVATGKITVSK